MSILKLQHETNRNRRSSLRARPVSGALGEFEHVLLFALVGLGGEAHGLAIRELVERETGRRRSSGAVHITFERE